MITWQKSKGDGDSRNQTAAPLAQVLDHYGLKPDKNHRLNCPFHNDKTPSLQVYYKTQSCYCFSTNCPTNGKSLDVIDFVMHKEGCSKHEAINKSETFIKGETSQAVQLSRIAILTKMFTYFCTTRLTFPFGFDGQTNFVAVITKWRSLRRVFFQRSDQIKNLSFEGLVFFEKTFRIPFKIRGGEYVKVH